jgi:hypothetical protein
MLYRVGAAIENAVGSTVSCSYSCSVLFLGARARGDMEVAFPLLKPEYERLVASRVLQGLSVGRVKESIS